MQLPKSPLLHEMQWTQLADLPEEHQKEVTVLFQICLRIECKEFAEIYYGSLVIQYSLRY